MIETCPPALSGERLRVTYRLACSPAEADARAREICVEQTVEFPEHLIDDPVIRDQVIGRVEALHQVDAAQCDVQISFALETAGRELTQLINLLFGNISIKPGVKLLAFDAPPSLSQIYAGPRFGQAGLRDLVAVYDRPLLCTAIKPMGMSPAQLAELAYRLALGGIDLIKDDHGLADQPFCRYDERVERCAAAVARASSETGRRCLYAPNVTAPAGEIARRARFAKDAGAGALLFCPGLAGFDAMRSLAADDRLALPILAHPAFLGSYCASPSAGLSHGVLYGQLNRLAGADATIFPNWGGRFAYSQAECLDIVAGATRDLGSLKPIFPVPAGGMRLDRVDEMRGFYGPDCVLLIGGDLHAQTIGLVESCRRFRSLAGQAGSRTSGIRSMK